MAFLPSGVPGEPVVFFLLPSFVETGSHISQAGLELTMELKMTA